MIRVNSLHLRAGALITRIYCSDFPEYQANKRFIGVRNNVIVVFASSDSEKTMTRDTHKHKHRKKKFTWEPNY
ncbi:hypothetical protein RIF29_40011 [Crotalaria pallida]|uniref:Uncharacterized protein n=1 Tax=Crotalaria pallida TaxID=3830 RepID=A0AAN9HQA7_CROPI